MGFCLYGFMNQDTGLISRLGKLAVKALGPKLFSIDHNVVPKLNLQLSLRILLIVETC